MSQPPVGTDGVQEGSSLQPIVDEIFAKTRSQLEQSNLFPAECVEKISDLLTGGRDTLRSADILQALSDPESAKESHEDS